MLRHGVVPTGMSISRGGTLNIYWWGSAAAHPKKGGLRHGHNPKKGVLGTGTSRKMGVLGTGTS